MDPTAIDNVDLQQEIRELHDQNDTLMEDLAAISTERDNLYEEKQELEADWTIKLHNHSATIQAELDSAAHLAEERRVKLDQVMQNCSTALTAVLTSSITGEDIPSTLLEHILEFPSIYKFSPKEVRTYAFANQYIGLGRADWQAGH